MKFILIAHAFLGTKIIADEIFSARSTWLSSQAHFPLFLCISLHLHHILLLFNDSSEKKKEIKCTLKNISDIYLKVKIGEKSIVILGHANHYSKLFLFILNKCYMMRIWKVISQKLVRNSNVKTWLGYRGREILYEWTVFVNFCSLRVAPATNSTHRGPIPSLFSPGPSATSHLVS